jgi:hypothetical protein
LGIVFFLQVLGWYKGNLTFRELAVATALTPFKMIGLFLELLVGIFTFGRVRLKGRFSLSTGGIHPPRWIEDIAFLNLAVGFFNFAPNRRG